MSRIATVVVTFCLLLATVACGSKPASPTGPSPIQAPVITPPAPTAVVCPSPFKAGSMSASINGSAWTAQCVVGGTVTAGAPVGTVVSVSGTDLNASARIIGFAFSPDGPGTYPVSTGTIVEGSSTSIVQSGSVTVRTISATSVSGSFTLVSPNRTVTGGEFTITF